MVSSKWFQTNGFKHVISNKWSQTNPNRAKTLTSPHTSIIIRGLADPRDVLPLCSTLIHPPIFDLALSSVLLPPSYFHIPSRVFLLLPPFSFILPPSSLPRLSLLLYLPLQCFTLIFGLKKRANFIFCDYLFFEHRFLYWVCELSLFEFVGCAPLGRFSLGIRTWDLGGQLRAPSYGSTT